MPDKPGEEQILEAAKRPVGEPIKTSIVRVRSCQVMHPRLRVVRILATWTVPNNDGGTGWHYEYDVEVT